MVGRGSLKGELLDIDLIIYPQFEAAAGRSSLFELKLRLLASKTKELESVAEAHKFDQVFRATVKHFSDRINDEEKGILDLSKKVRNKIVHAEFQAAFWMLKPEPSPVKVLKGLENVSGQELLGKIFEMAEGKGEATTVPKTKNPGKFGWLLEAATGGLFQKSIELNTAAIAIIDRISLDTALEGIEDPEIREKLRPKL